MKQFTIGNAEKELRLDQYLMRLMPGAGKSFLYKMLRKKNITKNGKKAEGNERLMPGDQICIYFSDETFEAFHKSNFMKNQIKPESHVQPSHKSAPKVSVPIIYEDADILIANKPAGMLSQKAEKQDYSLNDWFLEYLHAKESVADTMSVPTALAFTPSVANRLDRNTSGMILCGKTLAGLRYLAEILRDRRLHKYYLAVVCGQITKEQEIEGYLSKDARTNQVKVIMKTDALSVQNTTAGKARTTDNHSYICTSYRPLRYLKEQDVTLIEVLLKTGKTHQIRAHLASIGHPLAGDPKYGSPPKNAKYRRAFGLKRQLLHCYKLSFAEDAASGMEVCGRTFVCAPPDDFIQMTGEIYGNLEFPRS